MDEPPEIDHAIPVRKDERTEGHLRSFTKWINSKLSKTHARVQISDLFEDLRDGNALISLLEVLVQNKLPREKGKLRVHHVANIDIVFKTLEKERIKLHGISAQAIVDGNHKSTLGLVWSIILHYQVHGALQEEPAQEQETSANGSAQAKPAPKISQAAVEDKLLRWVQGSLEGYGDVVEVKDLSKSWSDGMAFNTLIHVHRNDLFDLEDVERMSNNDRLDHAFGTAEKHLSVQRLLEPSDVDQPKPDKKLVMLYVSSLYEALRQYTPVKKAKRRKVVEETMVASNTSTVESAPPEPSEPFLQFKNSLVQVSTSVESTESDYASTEQNFENQRNLKAWEVYEKRFQTVQSAVEECRENGGKALNDSRVSSTEAEEIQSDLKALQIRWSTVQTRTEFQRKRIESFQNNEEKELRDWRKQADIYLDWIDKMDDRLDKIEEMESQHNVSVLNEKAAELTRIGEAVNSYTVPRKVLEFGRGLIMRNVLTVGKQTDIKEQIIEMEKKLETLKNRAREDIDRLDGDIDSVKQSQRQEMEKWKQQAVSMCDWMDDMDERLEGLNPKSSNKDIENIREILKTCESLQETIKNDKQPHSVVNYGEALMVEKTLSNEQKTKIEKQLKEMNNEWKLLLDKVTQIKASLTEIRDESELEEKHKVEEWIRKFELLLKQMANVKESIAKTASLQNVNERYRSFQDCLQVVDTIKPDYQNAVRCGEEALVNDTCPDWEKSQISDDMELLKTTWKGVLESIVEEQKSINGIKSEVAGEQIEKIQKWREVYKEVDQWYHTMSAKVEENFTMGKTLPVVEQQIAEQEELSNEMVMTHETVEYLLSNGQELLQNANTPEAEKNKLRKDIANLVERWENLSEPVNNRLQRLSDMENHLQENLNGKLQEWTNQASSVEGWLTREEKKFQAMGGIAPNLEAAMKQKPRVEAMAKEMKQEEKKLRSTLRLGDEILADASLSEDDNTKLQQELSTVKNRWEALEEKIKWRIQRLDETISRLGSQQDDKLEKWREKVVEISDWLDKAQLRLAERGPIGSDLNAVRSQKEEFQVFLNDSLSFQRKIYGFTEFSENLRTDPCISEEERIKVLQKTKALNERWDVIVQQINSHHNALENKMEELEDKHQSERLAEWKAKSEPLQKWLTTKAIEAKSLREIGSDILAVQKQHGEMKVLSSRVENYGKHFREILTLAEDIEKDPLIEDEKARNIGAQGEDMTNRWSALKQDLQGRLERLTKKENELLDVKSNKVSEWKTKATHWKEWLKTKEDELESQGAVGTKPNEVKKQKDELESLTEELKLEKVNFNEVMHLSDEVLDMKLISDEDRRQIQQDKFAIKSRWETLQDNVEWKRKKLGNKESEFSSERTAKIQEWKNKTTPLQEWIKKEETKCESLQNVPENFDSVTAQINEIQILAADVNQKEKQLNIVFRLGEEVLQSPSLLDGDRMKLKEDSAMLKERWETLTEKLQSSLKSHLKEKSELEEEKRMKMEQWRERASLIEEWLAEEGNKFDAQGMGLAPNLDLVKRKREEIEIIFNDMLANKERLNSTVELYEEIQKHPSLSADDKRKLQQEMNKIKTAWKTLEEKMAAAVKRITTKESDLEKDRENRLEEWSSKRQSLGNWMKEREDNLENLGEIAQDLDTVRKQTKDLKISMEEFHAQLKEFRFLSRFGDEAKTHPSLHEQDRATVRNELTALKTRWKDLEEKMGERLKRLAQVEKKLLEERTNDMTEWKESASPVKDWIFKQEKKIQSHGVIKADMDSVTRQREEIETIFQETQKQRDGLNNLDSLHKKLQQRQSLSEEDKKKIQQELNSLKHNWSAIEETINKTHGRISKQEGSFNEEREVKMEEWRCKSAPLEQLLSEQGTKWEDDDDLESSDLETLRKYKLTTQADIQTIQKQQVELQHAIYLGDEVQKHAALRDEDRSKLRMEMSSLKNRWQSLEERMHQKVKRLSSKEFVFNEERSSKLVGWRNEVLDLQEWLAKEEKRLTSQGDADSDLASIRKLKVALETQLQEVQLQEKQLQTVVEMGNDAQSHAAMSEDDRKLIQQDIIMLENNFKTLTQKVEERIKRVLASEKAIEDEKDSKLEEWRNKLEPVQAWLASESKKLENDGSVASDLDTVAKQRREMEDVSKEMELEEKKRLTGVIRFGDDLKTHATLSDEDRRRIQEDVETLKSNWENMRETMQWKIKRLSEKEKDLKEQGSGKLEEWRSTVTPLQEWLSKEEQKLESQESLASDMINLRRQKQDDLAFRKELELQQKRVLNVASFGQEIANHSSLSEENRKQIEQCVVTVKNDWERLDEKIEWRLSSAEEKEKELEKKRTVKLQEWNVKLQALQTLLSEQENAFKLREGIAADLETVKFKKSEIEDMLKELELAQKKELNSIIQFGEDIFNDPSMSSEDHRRIKQEIGSLKSNLENLEEKMKWRAKRLSEKEKELEQFRAGKLLEWKTAADNVQMWLVKRDAKFQLFEDLSSDLDEVRQQKSETEVLAKEMETQENELNAVVQMSDQLLEHPSLFEEDRKQVEHQLTLVQNNWDVLFAKINKRVGSITSKETELDIEVTRVSVEWRNKVSPLREWIIDINRLMGEDNGVHLDSLRKQRTATQAVVKDMQDKDGELSDVISFSYKIQENELLSISQKRKIQEDSAKLKQEWNDVETTIEERSRRLNEDIRNFEQEQDSKLSMWQKTCKPLSHWLDEADQLISSSEVDGSDITNIKKQKKKIETLLEETASIEPKFHNLKETAESFHQNPCLSEQQCNNIQEQAEHLSNRYALVSEKSSELKSQLDESLELSEKEYQENNLAEWRKASEPVTLWISTQKQRLESLQGVAEDLETVQKQKEEENALVADVSSYAIQVETALTLNTSICEDPLMPDEATDVVAMQAKNIKNKWRNLNDKIQARSETLSMRLTNLLNEKQRRVGKWNDSVSPVAEWLAGKQEMLSSLSEPDSLDLDTARKQKNEVADVVTDLETQKATLDEVDVEVLHHPSIPEDERKKLKQQLASLRNTADNLSEKAERKTIRLKETVKTLETEQRGKLKEWQDQMKTITDSLKNAENVITEKSVAGADVETVKNQKKVLQTVLEHSLAFQNNIYEFTNFGEKLQCDPCISEDEKANIATTTDTLNKRWDLVLAQLKTRNHALEEQLYDLEEKHKKELLDRWNEKYEPFSMWLGNVENEVKSLKDVGDNTLVEYVQKQQEETKILISKVSTYEATFKDTISLAQTINDDPLIEDREAKAIDDQACSLTTRWDVVNDTINTRAESLRVRESQLSDIEQNLIHEWNRSIEPFSNWLSKVEEDGAYKLDGNGVNSIKDYSVRCKTLEREVEGRKPVLEEIEKLGGKLLAEPTVRKEEKTHIKEEMEILQERWQKLHMKIHDNTKWADIKLIELAKKEQETLDVWRKNVEPINAWLEETNGKLEELQSNQTNTETLKEKHLSLQRIKEDVTSHEDALARIVTIVGKLTDDENVSENEKNNIKAEMNRLQEKWNTTQNNVNINYLSITEALMELAQKEKASLEQWKKQTDPFKEWIVEAKGRFDNIPHADDGYDVVSERTDKLQTLSRELLEKEDEFENILQLKDDILQDDHLSIPFKDNIKNEGDALGQKWNELHDNVTIQSDRAEKHLVSLEGAQKPKLDKWQSDINDITSQQNEIQGDLKAFETPALDVDRAKKQSSDLKVLQQKLEVSRTSVVEVSSFFAEISNDPNVAKKEKARVKKDFDLVKEKQSRQEKETANHRHKLDSHIRELQDDESAKLENWKTASEPLHEWLGGIDDDAKEHDVMLGNISQAQTQLEELKKLTKEFKETEPDLFNVLKVGVELSADPQVSEDVRQSVGRDVASLRENHSNVDELLKSQRERMKSQLLKLQQHQERCLIDWNERKGPVDARTKAMEKRIRNLKTIEETFDEVQSQKDEVKKTEKELESLDLDVATILEYGETLCKDKGIFDEEKQVIRSEMKSMESSLNNSRNNTEKRKQDLNSKLDELRAARANEFLSKWRKCSSTVTKWMDTCEEEIRFEVDGSPSLMVVRKRLDEIDELSEKTETFEPEYLSTVKHGEEVLKEPSVELSDKEKVENELSKIKERWQLINDKLDSIMNRMEDQEIHLRSEHDENVGKWRDDVRETRDWCQVTQKSIKNLEELDDVSNYDKLLANRKELQTVVEMLPKYEGRVKELGETCQRLSQNSKNKTDRDKLLQENEALQEDFSEVKKLTESSKSNLDAKIANLESAHSEQLSEWNKRGERLERRLQEVESQWQQISHLENADKDEIATHRPQFETIVSNLKDLQPDYDRHTSCGHKLSVDPALNSDTRTIIQQKLSDYERRWNVLQTPKKLYSNLPRVAVEESILKDVDTRQVESVDNDLFDELFGALDSTDGLSCRGLMDWQVEYDSVLEWCLDAEKKVGKLRKPGEYMVLVERQHNEIEEMIQRFTSYETTVSKTIDKGNHLLADAESLRLSKDDKTRLGSDVKSLKTKWEELQEKAFDTERSLNEHVNKLQEFQDWKEKALALSQWLEMTDGKLDCCMELSDDLEERQKQKVFLQKFASEKMQNEESINDVLNLGRYIVTNHLVLKKNYEEVNDDVKSFKEVWNGMLSKASEFCKLFGVHFSHIDLSSADPFDQWKKKVKDLEKWLQDANEKLTLNENQLKEYSALTTFPESAKEISQGIDNYCVPQTNEIVSKGQDIFNSKKYNPIQNAEITDTIVRLSEKIKALRLFVESQKVHVRNATLAFFNKKLNASEAMVENVLENLKKLKSVGTHASEVREQVDLIKSSEVALQQHVLEFEDSKKQILEMEDKGYLSSDGFEGTLKVKTTELEPKLIAVEKQFTDTKNRLAKGVISFHGLHKDEVKKWLKYCEKKLNEINSDSDDINGIYEEYCKIQELRREIMKGEQSFLNTLELNERLIAEEMLNEKQGKEFQVEIATVATGRNQLQRQVQEKDLRLYASLFEGLSGVLTKAIHSFEETKTTLSEQTLSEDFDTATEHMDGAKRMVEDIEEMATKARGTLELTQKISTMGILILKENDKSGVEEKMKTLKEYLSTVPGKSREEFNRLLDDYLVLFKKEVSERKNWISVNENRMSSSYMDIESFEGFQEELKDHKDFAHELKLRDMEKMAEVAERVTELDKNLKMDVRNLEKRWKVMKQWSEDYSLDLQRVVMEWRAINQEQKVLIEWLDPHEKELSEINEKINLSDRDGIKQQLNDFKTLQSELEQEGVDLSNIHVKGMTLMKFLNEEATASRTIDKDLADLDRRWNTMAKDILGRIELLRNVELKQKSIKEQKDTVNTYIDETNSQLDDHETKNERIRGDIPQNEITENGESSREKKLRIKKEKETLQQDVVQLTKNLEERIANFPKYQSGVDRINSSSKELEDVADNDSRVVLHEELATFNARWQVIITRLEDYSDTDLPEHSAWGCMGFVKRRLGSSSF